MLSQAFGDLSIGGRRRAALSNIGRGLRLGLPHLARAAARRFVAPHGS
jgi:hypothetical protein